MYISIENDGASTSDLGYSYPNDMDLRPGSHTHAVLLRELVQDVRNSENRLSPRFRDFRKIDRVLNVYVRPGKVDRMLKKADEKNPMTIVCPYSLAILETSLAYLANAFIRKPIFRYRGTSPEDTIGAALLEKVIEKHCNNSVSLALYIMFRDALAYGYSFTSPVWRREEKRRSKRKKKVITDEFGNYLKQDNSYRVSSEKYIDEGNDLINIDPYGVIADPDVSIHDTQRMKFVGFKDYQTYFELKKEEELSRNLMFNVDYLKFGRHYDHENNSTNREDIRETSGTGKIYSSKLPTGTHEIVTLYKTLIPKDFGLSGSERIEKWVFKIANKSIILRANKLTLHHDQYPIVTTAPEFDGYSGTPLSRIESLQGMQKILDWLFNMHIANVRRAVNNVFVVDPKLINMDDITRPKTEGAYILRMRRDAWGRGLVDKAIKQLPIQDVTRAHIGDSQFIINMMEKTAGVDASSMGNLRSSGPDRLTGTEVQGAQRGMYSRMGRLEQLFSLQGMLPIAEMFARHTQQYMSQDMYLRVVGRWQETLMQEFMGNDSRQWNGLTGENGRFRATPFDLDVTYDLDMEDNSSVSSNDANVWMRMFENVAGNEQLSQEFDITRIFKHLARVAGAKNVDDFVRVKVSQNEEVTEEVDKGNLVPYGQS